MTDYRVTFMEKGRAALVRHPFDGGAAAGEIVGKNLLSLISTGSERGGFTQDFPADSYPMETGSSSIAQVLEVGEGVTGFAPGDLFYHNGHHTRYVRLPQGDAIAVPGGAEPEKVLFGRYAAVSMTSIYHMKARAVDNIIVTGQGMVGVMCAAVLQAFGFEVYAVDPSPERRGRKELRRAHGVQRQRECTARRAALPAPRRRDLSDRGALAQKQRLGRALAAV